MSGAEAVLVSALVLGNGADLASTEYALRQCPACTEVNPLGQNTPSRVAVKAAVTVVEVKVVRRLWKRHKVLAVVVAVGVVGVNGWAMQHNLRSVPR